ncbi:MAG: hypothetical protein HYZ11_02640 [Candidatus Tectomicrobia bacterium]|uniref:Uncharacterized protein n=1 Tax=Tectimicrobiota bacterium TaxID=2528274 RepID=A0A932HY59_UNCTE|nr:hypothetical protein [Candidatus Tectomicrobia bacterium]
MMKLKVRKASCHVEFDYLLAGSVLKGTVKTTWKGVTTRLDIDSEEPPEKIAALVRNAKGGCFAENLVTQQVSLHGAVFLNGRPVEMGEAH